MELDFDSIIHIGKYKGKTVNEIYKIDIRYLKWLTTIYGFKKEVKELVEQECSLLEETILENLYNIY